jgi:hypothetical protein
VLKPLIQVVLVHSVKCENITLQYRARIVTTCHFVPKILWRFPVNTSNNLWILDFMLDLLVISLGGIYNWFLHSQSHCTTVCIQPSNHT